MTYRLSNSEILAAYHKQGDNINQASLALGVSWSLVYAVVRGKRREPRKRERVRAKDLCQCCGLEPIDKDLTRFCRNCYQTAESGEIYPGCGTLCW